MQAAIDFCNFAVSTVIRADSKTDNRCREWFLTRIIHEGADFSDSGGDRREITSVSPCCATFLIARRRLSFETAICFLAAELMEWVMMRQEASNLTPVRGQRTEALADMHFVRAVVQRSAGSDHPRGPRTMPP